MRRRLAEHLGCEPSKEAVATARRARRSPPIRSRTTGACGRRRTSAGLVYDEGYPQPTISRDEFAADSGATVHRVGRIEPWIAELREDAETYAGARGTLRGGDSTRRAADPELVAFKSVIAYRTGLDVEEAAPDDYCERAFENWRADGFTETRQDAKPIRDRLLRVTLRAAKRHDRPVHIHCGGGDPVDRARARASTGSLPAPLASTPTSRSSSSTRAGPGSRREPTSPRSSRRSTSRCRSRCPGGASPSTRSSRCSSVPRRLRRCSTARTSRPSRRSSGCRPSSGARRSAACSGAAVERGWLDWAEAQLDRRGRPRRQRAAPARHRQLNAPIACKR